MGTCPDHRIDPVRFGVISKGGVGGYVPRNQDSVPQRPIRPIVDQVETFLPVCFSIRDRSSTKTPILQCDKPDELD